MQLPSTAAASAVQSCKPAHIAQRHNLDQWILSEFERYALLRYHPWTSTGFVSDALALQPSRHEPLRSLDVLGVVTTRPLGVGTVTCGYPGVLMSAEMHVEFAALYNSPTAIPVPQLDYQVDSSTARELGIKVSNPHHRYTVHRCSWGIRPP
jgi:hypothetical protein